MKRMQFPQDVEGKRRELRPAHNNAGGLEKVFLDDTLYVERIAYDAKGKRSLIAYGNGVMTRYACDPHTFGLKRLRSERYTKPNELTYHSSGVALQDFGYDYDLVGNILGISDRAPASGFLNNPEAASTTDSALAQLLIKGNALNRRFTYDPIYRLLAATGRECDRPPDGDPWDDQPRCTDLTKARAYDRAPPCQRIVHNVRPAPEHDAVARHVGLETCPWARWCGARHSRPDAVAPTANNSLEGGRAHGGITQIRLMNFDLFATVHMLY